MRTAVRARIVIHSSILNNSAWQSTVSPHHSPLLSVYLFFCTLRDFAFCSYVDERLGPDSVYDLYAVVVHTGAVLAGHYFSFMRPEVRPSEPPAAAPINMSLISTGILCNWHVRGHSLVPI
jgi:hypothetical protein